MTYQAVDLFAGLGGWTSGLAALGHREIGIELDKDCRATRRAAGWHTVQGDVRHTWPAQYPRTAGLIASPPCQTFSRAGKGKGRQNLDAVLLGVKTLGARQNFHQGWHDDRTGLVLEPLRWALERVDLADPFRWIAMEQVQPVLPVWEAVAEVLAAEGYQVATGVVRAEQYGVPQTRARAVLLARLGRPVHLPIPTHSRFYVKDRTRLDPGVLPWVSMAEALGWELTEDVELAPPAPFRSEDRTQPRKITEPSLTVGFGHNAAGWRWRVGFPRRDDLGGNGYRARDLRTDDLPALTVTEKSRSWKRWPPEDRVNNQSGTPWDPTFPWKQPAPVIAYRPLVTFPGANANRFNGATKSRNDGLRVTLDEVLRLQSFPGDYPVQGAMTARFRQVGDAVPPLLARALLAEVIW